MFKKIAIFLCATCSIFSNQLELSGNHLDEPLMEKMISLFHVDTLIETGTFQGTTAKLAGKHFKEVYTIELAPKLFKKAQERLKKHRNIHCLQGHSGEKISEILPKIKKGRVLFWLDAHYSGGPTAKGTSNSAIRDELSGIKKSGLKNGVILIDDLRGFHGKPESVEWEGGYPSASELKKLLLEINPDYAFHVIGDMAIAYPKEDNIAVSPLVEACTMSRLEESSEEAAAAKESVILSLAAAPEAAALDDIYRAYVEPATEASCVHYIVWKGLLSAGRGEHKTAQECFQKALASGYDHPRIRGYLAAAEAELDKSLKSQVVSSP